ncbi:MAG: hypothetical protein PHR35_23150 [Kiritimatiellae bacterium]|nr:hypothetical protein [Kiritimatiellia bacterium]
MTVFRTLRRLGYYSSYSHRGRFYTLHGIPVFDRLGLWSFRGVAFSSRGNLLRTAKALVESADAGYTAPELESTLQVEVKHSLLQLVRRKLVQRRRDGRGYVYVSIDEGRCRQQLLIREERVARTEVGMGAEVLPEEAKAAIVLFFSLLNEKQRRLYAGLEAAKLGYGGDRKMAELLGLDVHTVAKGRQELLGGAVDRGCIRQPGGGRVPMEKKRPKS